MPLDCKPDYDLGLSEKHVTYPNPKDHDTDSERQALVDINPKGPFIRQPLKPRRLDKDQTSEDELFRTIYMGTVIVDETRWKLLAPYHFIPRMLREPPSNTDEKYAATCVWSDGLESGTLADIQSGRYQKDLPIDQSPRNLFTTILYNEIDPTDLSGTRKRPVWKAEPYSIIVRPHPDKRFKNPNDIEIWGRALGADEIVQVEASMDQGETWMDAQVAPRRLFEWKLYRLSVAFGGDGMYTIISRAIGQLGIRQRLTMRRNHVHSVQIHICKADGPNMRVT
ncbi:hypothetical protein BBP40_007944 [Aspergillus hancockii]|nr:hypothetical protein BBP40_007944 [Aspergillus hancockii]